VTEEKITSIRLFKRDKTGYEKHKGLKAGFHNDIIRRTQTSEYYLCLKRGQNTVVYCVSSHHAASPIAESVKTAQCRPPMQTADN
jgi:hypothetical protein